MSATETIVLAHDAPPGWEDKLYEVVDGKYVEPAPKGLFEVSVATLLQEAILAHFLKTGRNGWVFPEVLFALMDKPARRRRPDLAYVPYDRWPRDRPIPRATAAWDVIPDLAVEVVNPGNTASEILMNSTNTSRLGSEGSGSSTPSRESCRITLRSTGSKS